MTEKIVLCCRCRRGSDEVEFCPNNTSYNVHCNDCCHCATKAVPAEGQGYVWISEFGEKKHD